MRNQQLEMINALTASKNSTAYAKAKEAILNPMVKIHVNTTSGSGRYVSVSDNRSAVVTQLQLVGASVVYGNDAPRGGRMGDYVIASLANS